MAEAQTGSNLYKWCSAARPQSFLSGLLTIACLACFPSSENWMRGRKPLSPMAATSFWTWLCFHTPLAWRVDIAPGVSELPCVLLSFLPSAAVLPAWELGVIWLSYAEVPRLLSVTSVSGIFVNLSASSQKYQRDWGHFSAWTWKAFAHWCSQDCHGEQRLLLIASNAFQVYASFFPLFQMASQSTETSLTDSPNN